MFAKLDESLLTKFPFLCKYVYAITNNIDCIPDADNSMEKSENDSSKSQLQAVEINWKRTNKGIID